MSKPSGLQVAQGKLGKYAGRYRRILFGGSADFDNVDDDDVEVWSLEDSYRAISADLDTRLTARRRQQVDAVRTFMPRMLQRSEVVDRNDIVMHRCRGCVVFSDASGFTKLTETLAQKADGAEVLSKCLNKFFTPLIDIIEAYRGDVIKFSGDALSILFEATDDYQLTESPCGSPDADKKTPFQLACLRGAACCLEIHKRLHNFDTGEGGVHLTLHIGVGAGDIAILKVGGAQDRFEYVIAGTPMEQIAIAEPLAGSGETVLSPQCWDEIRYTVVEGRVISDPDAPPGFHVLGALDTSLHTYPTVKQAAMDCTRIENLSKESIADADLLKLGERFIPRAVLKHLRSGNSSSINEMRSVTIIFSQIAGVDVSTERGSKVAQELMVNMQRACYTHEGNLNKFLVDDKGLLFLFVFGLPPLMHIDDPTRAVKACFEMARALKAMNLIGRFGITTGRVFCGIVGSDRRREYTVMGDTVNLSARLMAKAPENSVLIDEATYLRCVQDVKCTKLEPFMVKGKAIAIQAYAPIPPAVHGLEVMQLSDMLSKRSWNKEHTDLDIELGSGGTYKVKMPWRARSKILGGSSPLLQMTRWTQLKQVNEMIEGDGGLLRNGGSLSLMGKSGSGKVELCEHIVIEARKVGLLPLFGVMQSRLTEKWRAVAELMQNCLLALFRAPGAEAPTANRPTDDDIVEVLRSIVGSNRNMHKAMAFFGFDGFEVPSERAPGFVETPLPEDELQEATAQVCASLVKEVSKRHGVLVVLRMRRGTDLFDGLGGKSTTFWALHQALERLALARQVELASGSPPPGAHPILLVTVAREKNPKRNKSTTSTAELRDHDLAVAAESTEKIVDSPGAITAAREVVVKELSEDAAVELMCHCLGLSTKHGGSLVKRQLREFVLAVSIKNPTYIQECLDHLLREKALEVIGEDCTINTPDLNAVNIAEWVQTSMVGGTISRLESLKSAQNHIMKLATVFEGPFSPLDLAAANRVLFGRLPRILAFHDQSKLLAACKQLVEGEFLKKVEMPVHHKPKDCAPISLPRWTVSNSLFRKVAGCMLLNSQRLLIKRSVLIERALNVEIPKRIRPGMKGQSGGRMKASGAPGLDGKEKTKELRWDVGVEGSPFDIRCADDVEGVKSMDILLAACALGNVRMAGEALKCPHLDVNRPTDVGGCTPLHYAAGSGEVEIVHMLCDKAAHVHLLTHKQETPVYIAAQRGHLEVVQYLCEWRNALALAHQDRPEFWEQALPELLDEDDILPPMNPTFTPSPDSALGVAALGEAAAPDAIEAVGARRREVLNWLKQRLRPQSKEGTKLASVAAKPDIRTKSVDDEVEDVLLSTTVAPKSGNSSMHASEEIIGAGAITASLALPVGSAPVTPHTRTNGMRTPLACTPTPIRTRLSFTRSNIRSSGGAFNLTMLLPAAFRNAAWRGKVRNWLRGRVALVVMLVALAIALYLPDIWVTAGVPTSTGADVVLILVMVLFATELILLSVVDTSYPFSFFFCMDCIGTISMISDISFLLGSSASQEQTSRASEEDLTLFRATRTAKIGARAGRLSRLVKLMKFLPGIGVSSRAGGDGEKLQQISNQLTNVLSKRVAFLTIIMVIIMPLFSLGAYPEGDFSPQVWMESLSRRVQHVKDYPDRAEAASLFQSAEVEFASFYRGKDYGPYEICVFNSPELEGQGVIGCRDLSGTSGFRAPERKSFRMIVTSGNLRSGFDNSAPMRAEANMSLALISLVIVLMCGACTLLNYAASELAVRPLERMLSSIKKSAKAIFSTVSAIEATGDEDFGEDMDGEVALLEKVVRKIATLAEISSKKNPFDDETITGMKNEELGILALTALTTQSKPAPMDSYQDRGGPSEISVTMKWQLEEIGLRYTELDSWDFNIFALTAKKQEQISAWFLMNNPGSCNFTEHNVDNSKLRAFVQEVAAGYKPNPYHAFLHAVDVVHTVFRYLTLLKAERYVSMIDQFALLVASVGHDIGHIGLNNSFLTEVQHDLAIRYNDRSPLENMHCSKLFEILAKKELNVLANAPDQFRDVRKTIIEVILHTDITQHPGMAKELELLYEMNSKVFEAPGASDKKAEEREEILQSSENKKLIPKVLLHSADISNPTKPWDLCREWALRVLDEYANQGDQEKQMGIPVQVLNDREKVNRPNSQIGFIEFIITPWWVAKVKVFPDLFESCQLLEGNLSQWERAWLEESNPSEAEREKVKERVQKIIASLRPAQSRGAGFGPSVGDALAKGAPPRRRSTTHK